MKIHFRLKKSYCLKSVYSCPTNILVGFSGNSLKIETKGISESNLSSRALCLIRSDCDNLNKFVEILKPDSSIITSKETISEKENAEIFWRQQQKLQDLEVFFLRFMVLQIDSTHLSSYSAGKNYN